MNLSIDLSGLLSLEITSEWNLRLHFHVISYWQSFHNHCNLVLSYLSSILYSEWNATKAIYSCHYLHLHGIYSTSCFIIELEPAYLYFPFPFPFSSPSRVVAPAEVPSLCFADLLDAPDCLG